MTLTAVLDVDGLASAAKEEELDRYLDLLGARDLVDGWTTSADVDSTEPAPDLVRAALEKAGGASSDAVMVGDSGAPRRLPGTPCGPAWVGDFRGAE